MIEAPFDRATIPHKPGIYIYRSENGDVLYVGKAIDLYNRVSSYFSGKALDAKTMSLVSNIRNVETVVVESELEALILEANLIKKFLPLYNIRLTDDKDYLYIALTDEEFPKVITARKTDLKPIKNWFGPFPSAKTVKTTLKQLRRIFPWCSNPPGPRNKSLRPCFYFHIRLCPGACVGAISREDYLKIIKRLSKLLDGKKEELIEELMHEMQQYSEEMKYEEASRIKRTITGLEYLTQPNRVREYLGNPNFLQEENVSALKQLQKDLKLAEIPERIEAYDISNFQGKESTGSLVVLTHGEIDKSQYRKFKIKITGKPNDVGMHKEMMDRRLNHPEWETPQLILIDGGRGQVKGVFEILQQRGLSIPIYGLAKRMEWLYPPEGDVVKLPRRSPSLRLLQKIRDESHRFAVSYHRKLRQKSFGL
jgi:excinuclease ABC subunit C